MVTLAGMEHAAFDAGNPEKDDLRRIDLGLRPRTMRQRLIYLRHIFRYRCASDLPPWFTDTKDLENYMDILAEGRCAPSTLDSVLMAIRYIEKAGGEEDGLATKPSVTKHNNADSTGTV